MSWQEIDQSSSLVAQTHSSFTDSAAFITLSSHLSVSSSLIFYSFPLLLDHHGNSDRPSGRYLCVFSARARKSFDFRRRTRCILGVSVVGDGFHRQREQCCSFSNWVGVQSRRQRWMVPAAVCQPFVEYLRIQQVPHTTKLRMSEFTVYGKLLINEIIHANTSLPWHFIVIVNVIQISFQTVKFP